MSNYACPKCGGNLRKNGAAGSGRTRWVCRAGSGAREFCYSTTNPEALEPRKRNGRSQTVPVFTRTLGKKTERFIITAAQNATPVHPGFMRALKQACEHLSAELLVIPLRYKNPTSRWATSQANDEIWAPELVPYLFNRRLALNRNLVVLGDVKTQPTAVSPLTGFEAITAGESCILGHTKLQLKSVPTPQSKFPKLMTTTGACTVRNYTDTKTGKIGEFHHVLGAAMVEVRGKIFHLRQLNADKAGSFYDLDKQYGVDWMDSGVADSSGLAALSMGDTHVRSIDPKVRHATFGPEGIVEILKPKALVYHDLLDGYSVNHHHLGNPFIHYAKGMSGAHNVKAEVLEAIAFVLTNLKAGREAYVVDSNHNEFFSRWVMETDWRTADPVNKEFYLETALAMLRQSTCDSSGTSYPSAFEHWLKTLTEGVDGLHYVGSNDSLELAGIEHGMHGDRGPNGARGSIKNLRRIGVKSNIGHSHSPGIEEGCYQAGTSTYLRLEYNKGVSSWLNTHIATYLNGKRTLINIINGEWRL